MLDALTALAAADRPPGARALALSTGTALLRRTRQPCVNSAHVYRPLQVCGIFLHHFIKIESSCSLVAVAFQS